MAPLVPRMDVFEFADFDWFPKFLRPYFQAALTAAWTTDIPFLHRTTPARLVARLLSTHLPPPLSSYTIIDFCAGGGGPSPFIERYLNTPSSRPGAAEEGEQVRVVLTDLHPHPTLWQEAAARRPGGALSYVAHPVDAANVPASLVEEFRGGGGGEGAVRTGTGGRRKVFRMFCLSFHHFGDGLARRILKGTVDGAAVGEGFGIFELQDRSIYGFLSCCMFGIATMLLTPYFAIAWREPLALVFTYLFPVLPAVLVFDGWMSCLRTRTPDEVEALLRTCGAEGGEAEIANWEIKSGTEVFLWPAGRVNWIIAVKKR